MQPDDTLATHDVGPVGYFADYKMIDLVGFVNKDVLKYHDKRESRDYIDLVRPNYLLIFAEWDVSYLRLAAANQPEKYELIKLYPGGSVRTQVYQLYRVHYQ